MLRPRRHKHKTSRIEPEPDEEIQPGLRLSHRQSVDGQKSTRSSPMAWNIAVPTHQREKVTEGLLMGCAVAEALSLARNGVHPRVGLKLFGRNPLHFQFQPGIGVTSHRTHALLMTFQAMLQSKTDPKIFSSSPTCFATVTEVFSIALARVLASVKNLAFFLVSVFW